MSIPRTTGPQYLSVDQVYALNEKHGWFEFSDAQGDVSRAFAQDAIAMHERMREKAPELLALLRELLENENTSCYSSAIELHGHDGTPVDGEEWAQRARALIAHVLKATP